MFSFTFSFFPLPQHTNTHVTVHSIYQHPSGFLDATASGLQKCVTGSGKGLSGKLNYRMQNMPEWQVYSTLCVDSLDWQPL